MGPRGARVGRRLRIALVHPRFAAGGGAERYAGTLGAGLARRGHEVHLYGWGAGEERGGARFHRVPVPPLGRTLRMLAFRFLTRRLGDAGRFDVVQGFGKTTCQTVHRVGGGVHRAFLEATGARRLRAYDRAALGIEEALFASPRLRAVVCPSRWSATQVARWYPSVEPRLRVVPNGVDTAVFRPEGREGDRRLLGQALGIPAAAPVFLFAASNFRLKGLDLALEALVRRPAAWLLVAGGDRPDLFVRRAGELGVADRVRFLGARSGMEALYRAADLLLHPTRYDPFANVCLEAMACGTPVVTTDRNGAADVLAAGKGGRVVRLEDGAEALAAAAADVLGGGATERDAALVAARQHGLVAHLAAVESLYQEVLAGSAPASRGGAAP